MERVINITTLDKPLRSMIMNKRPGRSTGYLLVNASNCGVSPLRNTVRILPCPSVSRRHKQSLARKPYLSFFVREPRWFCQIILGFCGEKGTCPASKLLMPVLLEYPFSVPQKRSTYTFRVGKRQRGCGQTFFQYKGREG